MAFDFPNTGVADPIGYVTWILLFPDLRVLVADGSG